VLLLKCPDEMKLNPPATARQQRVRYCPLLQPMIQLCPVQSITFQSHNDSPEQHLLLGIDMQNKL
jgi:hypothetical protein